MSVWIHLLVLVFIDIQDRSWEVLEPVLESLPRLIENKSFVLRANGTTTTSSSSPLDPSFEAGASSPMAEPHPALAQLCDALCFFVSEKNVFHRIIHASNGSSAAEPNSRLQGDAADRFTRSDFHVKVHNFSKKLIRGQSKKVSFDLGHIETCGLLHGDQHVSNNFVCFQVFSILAIFALYYGNFWSENFLSF